MSRLFKPAGESIGASASVLPVIIQGWFPLGLTGLISFQSGGLSGVFVFVAIFNVKVCPFTKLIYIPSHAEYTDSS